jgi:oligosaccharide repeat unit polymerase
VSRPRDLLAPGVIFPLAFVVFYTVPYLDLVDYSDIIPPPGVRMAFLALLGLASYLSGLSVGRLRWSTARLAWPRVEAASWRRPHVLFLLAALTIGSIGVLAFAFRAAAMIPLLAANREAARFAFVRSIGNPLNAATRLPITAAIGCGLYLLVSERRASASNAVAGFFLASAIVAEALLGHRGLPLFVVAPLLVCFHYLVRPIGVPALAGSGGLVVVGLAVANQFRLASSPPQLAHLLSHSNLPGWMPAWSASVVTLVAFGPLTFNFVLSKVPGTEPFQHGMALINGAFGILPGHQPTIGEFVSHRLFGFPEASPNLPPTILGGFYLDFGVVGIVAGMFLVGMMTQFLYWRVFARPSVWSTFLYAYWCFNLFVALYGDFIANDYIWFLPLSVYAVDVSVRLVSRAGSAAAG